MDEREAYAVMLFDLQHERLEVELVPSRDTACAMRGGKIRVVARQNPSWYRSLCDRYQSSRRRRSFKSDTRIKRGHIVSLLTRLARGETPQSKYLDDLRDVAEDIMAEDAPPF